jgi:hypothetical protein
MIFARFTLNAFLAPQQRMNTPSDTAQHPNNSPIIALGAAEAWPQPHLGMVLAQNLNQTLLLAHKRALAIVRWTIDPANLNAKQPDVAVYKMEAKGPVLALLTIEIEQTAQLAQARKKTEDYFESYPDLREGFVYDFQKKEWARYYRDGTGKAGWMKAQPYLSRIYRVDLRNGL